MNSFLITSTGRTGTRFLSRFMDYSSIWTVRHQPNLFDSQMEDKVYFIKQFFNAEIPEWQQCRFDQDYYGEVNGALRYNFLNIKATRKGIIYREPKDVILSFANGNDIRSKLSELIVKVKDVNLCDNAFYKILIEHPEILLIDFEQMTTDGNYLNKLLRYFGIEDVIEQALITQKIINSNGREKYKTYEDLPKEVIDLVNSLKWKEYKQLNNKL